MDNCIVNIVLTIALGVFVYLGRLLIKERGDFEVGGRFGKHEFFVKAKQRKERDIAG
jgi:hypothetical protein